MERRSFLVTCAAAGLAGCSRRTGEPTVSNPPASSPSGSDGPTGTRDGSTVTTSDTTGTPSATPSPTPVHSGYETTEVRAQTPDGTVLGTVTAAVADTPELRYLGLSDTESLPPDRGMLFVYDEVQDLTFVMREMEFGIDIVYADGEGTITRIHHAAEPGPGEDGSDQRYPGRGQFVLEVNLDWTTDNGVEEGDTLAFDL